MWIVASCGMYFFRPTADTIIGGAVGTLLFYFLGKHEERSKERRELTSQQRDKERWATDGDIIDEMNKFEADLKRKKDLPDAIRSVNAYVFRYLMKGWLLGLLARHRHDDTLSMNLRKDMYEYMNLLSDAATTRFLALEGRTEEVRLHHDLRYQNQLAQIAIIEQSFATRVGEHASQTLRDARAAGFEKYAADGTPAPPGYHYDFLDRLEPDNPRHRSS
jgi:hypothetical protein